MAMSKTAMATAIVTAIDARNTMSAAAKAEIQLYWEDICTGIIDEIVAGAITSTEVTAGSSAGTYEGDITS